MSATDAAVARGQAWLDQRVRERATAPEALAPLPVADAIERARVLLEHDQQPAADAYPLASLGPLAEVAREIATGAQVRPAMTGQAVLTTAALLASRAANVRSLDGAAKPLGLYGLTVALSGDGKDAADRPALRAVHEWQREQAAAGRDDHWTLASDITAEGLRRSFKGGAAAQGVFSTEAGAVLAGYALSADHRVKTAAALCGLFDRGHLSVLRAGEGRTERYGVRLSAHLLVQPAALGDVLLDESLAGIGFWPRFLLAWPPPLDARVYRPWRADQSHAVGAYWRRCTELLALTPEDCDRLPVLEPDAEATRVLATLFERMERAARGGEMNEVRPFALRAVELACRVAGVLAVWAGRAEVSAAEARCAVALVVHSLDQWTDALAGRADPVPGWALTLYRWLAGRLPVAVRDVPRLAPVALRTAGRRDAAIERLRAVGLADVTDGLLAALGVDRASR